MHLDACSCATIPPADVDVLCAAAFSPSYDDVGDWISRWRDE
ncbi:hypothetical protein BU14_0197s0020 [Porphyra umbilicalis]|uniref:Uncharacterized protein n=1 Tax=Porphyra umbilicalis TaxID=2786 RepID=A0A1X6P658_PORUM|nr:hypothetical protein BU14_0197s0020 [Porphyra umbilicalis]|eukprot:OSX76324.1 hypothetical protein BU14_0197s0020 [Porphyra umbilicalis]